MFNWKLLGTREAGECQSDNHKKNQSTETCPEIKVRLELTNNKTGIINVQGCKEKHEQWRKWYYQKIVEILELKTILEVSTHRSKKLKKIVRLKHIDYNTKVHHNQAVKNQL